MESWAVKPHYISKSEIEDISGFDINDALMRVHEMLSEGVEDDTIRETMHYVPAVHWKPLLNRAKAVLLATEHSMPPELRQAWVRAQLNKIVAQNANTDPGIAIKALTQIGKDPELQLTAKTATIQIDMSTASRLEILSRQRTLQLKATDGVQQIQERKPDE
jgi:hypothetical protein